MNRAELEAAVRAALGRIAPEALPGLDDARPLRDQAELDSMDVLRFLAAVRDATGIEIPEADARRLESVDDLVGYLSGRGAAGARA
jgi:polyketide biosynthesis acyl carrier protein